MKKLFLALVFIACLIPFTSYAKNNPPTVVPQPSHVISGDTWSFTVPSADWVNIKAPNPEIRAALLNPEKHNMVLLIKEQFAGTNEQYVLAAMQSLKSTGAKFKSVKHFSRNGDDFVVIETTKDNMRAWFWVIAKGGFGYGFSCGGFDAEVWHRDLCFGMANTLTIN